MKEISILLPSLRPQSVERVINEFTETNYDVDYEIVVVSPFHVKGKKVIWIKEDANRTGSVSATNVAHEHSTGIYVTYFSDDVHPTLGCLREMLDFMKSKPSIFLGAFKMIRPSGGEIGPFGAYNRLYACYGCITNYAINLIGGLFHPSFVYSWCDIDLSLRCWTNKGTVEICEKAQVIPIQIEDELYKKHRERYFERDAETFLEKWHPILGQGLERNQGVNKKLYVN